MKHREERFRDYHDATLPMIVWIERRFEEDTVLVRAMRAGWTELWSHRPMFRIASPGTAATRTTQSMQVPPPSGCSRK